MAAQTQDPGLGAEALLAAAGLYEQAADTESALLGLAIVGPALLAGR